MISKKLSIARCPLSIMLAFLPLSAVYAQQDSTLNRTVVVENEYNPHIMDASKINVLPRVEEPAVVKKGIEYATALCPVSAWGYENMSPIAREWPLNRARRGYVRAGYGNYGNVDLKAGYLWDITSADRLKVGVSLDGMNGTLKDWREEDWKSRFYRSRFNLDYSHTFSRFTLDLGGKLGSQTFNYMPVSDNEDIQASAHQTHTSGDFHVGLSSHDESLPVQFRIQTGLQYFGVKHPVMYTNATEFGNETKIHTLGDVWGKLSDEQRIGIAFQMDNLMYSEDSVMNDRTSLCLNPYYMLESDTWRLRLGAHVDWRSGEDSGVDVAPDVKLECIFSDSYVFYVHALGGRELNDFHRLNALSPYWYMYHSLPDTYVSADAKAGLKASPVNGLWFNVFGGYRISKNELFSNLSLGKTFFCDDKAKVAYAGAEVKYDYKDLFGFRAKGVYYNWEADGNWTGSEDIALRKPKLELDFRADARVFEGLNIHAGYEYVKRKEAQIAPVSNLYAGARYEFLPQISVFAQINNLLNKSYTYEYGYPAEKLNVLAGFSLFF